MFTPLRLLVPLLVAALAISAAAGPAEAGSRKSTSVQGWGTQVATVAPGRSVTTRIRVRTGHRTQPRQVLMQHRRNGGGWRVIGRARTSRDGRARLRGVPSASGRLRVVVRPTRRARGKVTASRPVRVSRGSQRSARLSSEVLHRVNRLRRTGTRCAGTWHRPVRTLRHHGRLAEAARDYARRMAVHRFFGHVDRITGHGPGDRATAAGYRWAVVGENVGAGYATPRAVVAAWRKSPTHCRNLMDPRWKHLGVGWYHGGKASRWGHYWGQLFGRPA